METKIVAVPFHMKSAGQPQPTVALIKPALDTVSIDVFFNEMPLDLFEKIVDPNFCAVGDVLYPLYISPCDVRVIVHAFSKKEADECATQFESHQGHVMQVLEEWAGLFLIKKIRIHLGKSCTHASMPVVTDDEIDIFIFMTPSHSRNAEELLQICGLPVNIHNNGIPVLLPACPLRGNVIEEDDKAVVQYIDNTFYLLFEPMELIERGGDLAKFCFAQIMLDALAQWREQKNEEHTSPDYSRATFLPLSIGGIKIECELADERIRAQRSERIEELGQEIKRLEQRLLEKRRDLHRLRFENNQPPYNPRFARGHSLNKKAIAALKGNPLVRSIEIAYGVGIFVRTNLLIIEHKEKRYAIGIFGIIFKYDGHIEIWTEETMHPNGVPHPHISLQTGPCMGSASDVIHTAMAEYRFNQAVSYFLMWLKDGYAPENVFPHPIEEWPEVALDGTLTLHKQFNSKETV